MLEFDGQHLTATSAKPYEPTSLDSLLNKVTQLQEGARSSDGVLSKLTWLAVASLMLNVVVIAVAFRRKAR